MELQRLQVTVPSYFKCPISLDLMRDPVSVCTGVTYDRSSIEKWLEEGHITCPATMQILQTHDLIPNHTLRRLIQAWCVSHKAMGVERIPTPRQPLDRHQVQALLQDAAKPHVLRIDALRKLREKAKESLTNRKCMTEAGAIEGLCSIFSSFSMEAKDTDVCEEALGTLSLLPLDDAAKSIMADQSFLSRLSWVLNKGSLDARINAAMLIEQLASVSELNRVVGGTEGVVKALVELLREDLHQIVIKKSLRALRAIASSSRNSQRLVEAGAVPILVELLPSVHKYAEHVLFLLESICKCAEGRSQVAMHALAIPAITLKLSRVSEAAADSAIGILWAVCSFCGDEGAVQERAVEAGLFHKLLVFLQMELSASTKHKTSDILRVLRNVCKDYAYSCNLDDAISLPM